MARPRPELLRNRDLHAALHAVGDIMDASGDASTFAAAGVDVLSRLIPNELGTLSRCDMRSGRRAVLGASAARISVDARAAFDRHFAAHPLVRYHAFDGGRHAHRISDSLSPARFRDTALFAEYYRVVGLDHAIALSLGLAQDELVSFVLNRAGADFSERELALFDALRPPLAALFARIRLAEQPAPTRFGLTPREAEVMLWVGAGKTDRDIGEIVGCSPRTVHKHLQHVFQKLGVETRTAAAMRLREHATPAHTQS